MDKEIPDKEIPEYKTQLHPKFSLNAPDSVTSSTPDADFDFSIDDLPFYGEEAEDLLSPKQALKDFILATVATEDTTSHSFIVPEATTIAHVKKYVHRMRVELSRIRTQIIRNGEKPKQFSTLIKNVEIKADEETQKIITTVTLSTKITPNVKPEMEELMAALTIEE